MTATWDCVVNERGADGKRHYWNTTVEAVDASTAAYQAVALYDDERVDGVEVERRDADYSWGRS